MNARPPQFGLKTVFAFVTWIAAIAGLAVSQLAGWTMTAVAFSLGVVNCSGRLDGWQHGAGRTRLFWLGWTILVASLFLPALKGCGNQSIRGWQAAIACGQLVIDPPGNSSDNWAGVLAYVWLTLGNALLLGSPFLLWRLQRNGGRIYGTLLAMAVATMCGLSIGYRNGEFFLIGYYVWCLAGLSLLSAYRMRWSTLALMVLAVLLVHFASGVTSQ
ncbi:MAG TPA: hypothetical protein VHC22_23295 [Pirellulales bacterium]|nr:hypothetical protein [Pirellulales bacterium]